MKRCPECGREYDNTMMFCLDEGAELLYGPARPEPGAVATGFLPNDEPATAILHLTDSAGEAPTRAQINTTDQTAILHTGAEAEPQKTLSDSTEKHSFSANRAAKPLIAAVVAKFIKTKMETGTIIIQYKIISAIGKGGMGEVFLARDTKLSRQVALKILPPEFAAENEPLYP